MKPHILAVALASFVLSAAGAVPFAQAPGSRPDAVDLAAIQLIKDEGLQRSQVMDTAWNLTEVFGPRLTNSPAIRAAAEWAGKRLTGWGVANVRQEAWGPFGRGWANDKFTANLVGAAAVSADRVSAGVDPRHQRAGHRGSGRPEHPQRPGHGHVEWQACRQGRDAGCAGGSARSLHAARPEVYRPGADRPPGATSQRRARTRGPGWRTAAGSQLQPALHGIPGQGRRGGHPRVGQRAQRPRRHPGVERPRPVSRREAAGGDAPDHRRHRALQPHRAAARPARWRCSSS